MSLLSGSRAWFTTAEAWSRVELQYAATDYMTFQNNYCFTRVVPEVSYYSPAGRIPPC